MIKLFVGLIAVCVRAAFGPMRLASGILLWLVSPTMRLFPHRALRSPSELEDGRDYLFGKRGNRVRRTFFADTLRAAAHPRDAFTLAEDSSTGMPGTQNVTDAGLDDEPDDNWEGSARWRIDDNLRGVFG